MQLVAIGGRPCVVKTAGPGPAAERLAAEAEVLAAARHPGVVAVVHAERLPNGGFELALAYAGPRTVADLRPPVDSAASIAAALAATVADLHAVGIRHGRVRPNHVVLDATGRPVLCGFGAAGRDGDPADDVAGVGEVLRALVGTEADVEPIPERRLVRRPPWTGATRRALLTLADQATADEPARRPAAADLAASIAALVVQPARRARPAPPRPPKPAIAAGAVAAVGMAVFAVGRGGSGAATASVAPEPIRRLDPVTHVDGLVVEFGGTRYAVGEPGDALAVADWDCDGTPTVVAVRPGSGEVFVFDRWGDGLSVDPAAVVPGAVRAEAGSCATVVVVDRAGERTEVPV